ncbi:MAG: hypothetical protein AAF639_12330 [Chloroflexota bacterium]
MEKTIMVPIAESIYEDVIKEAAAMNMTITEVVNYYLTVDAPVPNEYNQPIEENVEDTVENRLAALERLTKLLEDVEPIELSELLNEPAVDESNMNRKYYSQFSLKPRIFKTEFTVVDAYEKFRFSNRFCYRMINTAQLPRVFNGFHSGTILKTIITADDARRKANGYLSHYVSTGYSAKDPKLPRQDKLIWQMLVIYKTPGLSPVRMGFLDIDAETGDVAPFTEEEIQLIRSRASAFVKAYTPSTKTLN